MSPIEPVDVRLARIEEGIVYSHKKMDDQHKAIMGAILPVITTQTLHHDDITELKRDRFWLFTLAGGAFALGVAGIGLLVRMKGAA